MFLLSFLLTRYKHTENTHNSAGQSRGQGRVHALRLRLAACLHPRALRASTPGSSARGRAQRQRTSRFLGADSHSKVRNLLQVRLVCVCARDQICMCHHQICMRIIRYACDIIRYACAISSQRADERLLPSQQIWFARLALAHTHTHTNSAGTSLSHLITSGSQKKKKLNPRKQKRFYLPKCIEANA